MLKIVTSDGIIILSQKIWQVSVVSGITFSEIMEFYPRHNSSIYEDLKRAVEQNSLIPFVGAGLSMFCGYLGWPTLLRQLAGFIYDKDIQSEVEQLISDGKLLEAAQKIEYNYPRMLRELQKLMDYSKIKECNADKLCTSAVYALPYLFQDGLIMTTNFDRVLEEIYDKCHKKFGNVITPYEPDLLTQARQGNPHCLFKLHGDIGPEIHDIKKLVFTQEQYDKAYMGDGALMKELSQWFQNKRLLFLGCSLLMDKTMEVLQQVTAENPGLDHYAILECSPDMIGQRSRELGDLGISPVFYPQGKHEAVRVLLERLLEETNNNAYKELYNYTQSIIASTNKEKNRFMYDSDYIVFTGRENELEQLYQFCQQSEQLLWWAVTGPGGIGKSRLVHEFAKRRKEEGWEICWLKHQDYSRLSELKLPVGRCIIIADDIQSHLQVLGDWFASVFMHRRSESLRILLLEREGKNLESAGWAEMLQSDSPYDDTLSEKCYCSDFLQLKPLQEDELKTIMINFAAASGKPLINTEHAERLLKTLQTIDEGLQRPIYALAITDAWCNGEDPAHWDKGQVLEELIKRELKFYYGRLQNLSQKKVSKETRSELENLLARSCVMQFLPLESIKETEYPKLRKKAEELDMDFFELLRQVGVVYRVILHITEKTAEGSEEKISREKRMEAVVLDCPDLVKEYLVLWKAFDKGKFDLIFPEGWDNCPEQLFFFRQVLWDYPERLEKEHRFWKEFFAGNPNTVLYAQMYGSLLFGVTAQVPKLKEQAALCLETLYHRFQDCEGVAIEYAEALVNLSAEQSLEDCIQSVDKLHLLHGQFQDSEGLAVEYAKGLVNLTSKQSLENHMQSVDILQLLYEQFQDSEELAVEYARGLYNLTTKQELTSCMQSVVKLQALWESGKFQNNEELALAYARGLTNLSSEQSLEDCVQSTNRLKMLYKQLRESKKLMFVYAGGLVNLALIQTAEADIQETLKKSKELLEQYPEETELQLFYAQTKFNLTLVQSPDALQQTVAEIREFLLEHLDVNSEFQLELDKYLDKHPDHAERYVLLRV